jgi:outer membrane protein
MKQPISTLMVFALLAVPTPFALAQQPGGQAPAGQPRERAARVAILNVRQAIISSAEGKQASAELQSQFAARQSELENLRKQLQDLQSRLQTDRVLSDQERTRLSREFGQLQRLFQRRQEDFQEDLNLAENEVVERIGSKMMEVIDRYARENNLAVVLDVSGQGGVVYADPSVDITQDIIRLYDQAHPVSATPRPAQQPPGQTRPQPPPQQQQPGQRPPQP